MIDRYQRSAQEHDREAGLNYGLAAETSGHLHFGFLHAAEAHRAAARRDRALSATDPEQPHP